jgi:WD40 repeat protein
MHPACRVLFRIDSKELASLAEKYHAELAGPGWWRAAYIALGDLPKAPRPLFASSTKGELEFLLPPGRVNIYAYGGDVKSVERTIEIKSEDRELVLGTFDLSPSEDAMRGRFPNHHRVRQKNAAGEEEVVFRRIHGLPLRGMARDAQDVAFSPDGKRLATAHFYNAEPGEVMLWDTTTGARVATWPVADHGVSALAFSADGRILAGLVRPMAERRAGSEAILWDVASGRELRRLDDPGGGMYAMAFTPDGRTLATHGRDGSVRFRHVSTGQEVRRIDGIGSGRGLAFTPDGRTLAIAGGGRPFTLWDLAGDRRVAPAPVAERFSAYAIAIAPDGRTLAAAGMTSNAQGRVEQGQVWLYDLTCEPIARRAVLTFDGGAPVFGDPNDRTRMCSDVAFTPDGRRVVAVGMLKVRIWDAATGAEQDAFARHVGSSDRLAVSPDGRWLAITSPVGNGVGIVDIPPGP